MQIEVVTLFPSLIADAMRHGVVGRAVTRGLLRVGTEDPRAHTLDVHRTVDDRPYGGGPGMVMTAGPLSAAIGAARARLPAGSVCVALTPQGQLLRQALAVELGALPGLILVAGRYEGMDERVLESAVDRQISIGDYVLSGGELPALVLIDVIARLIPGVLGDECSSVEESFGDGLLDWPHYTRPEAFEGASVPPVLMSGDHAAIRRWRLKQSVGRTWLRRPELIGHAPLNDQRRQLLAEFLTEWREPATDLRKRPL